MLYLDLGSCMRFWANPTQTGSRTGINMDKCNKGYPSYEMSSIQGRVNRVGLYRFGKRDDVGKQVCEFMYGAERMDGGSLNHLHNLIFLY